MSDNYLNNTPPIIRVFLSSTFADMDYERSYFNEVLAPKIHRICAERGVSFFSVDLRWGITQEEQMDGRVLPICLDEIDKCRPYFIGILGNRYGTIMETVPEQISSAIPWLSGKEGRSITELEMLYAVLDHSKNNFSGNSSFYFRSDQLSKELYGSLAPEDAKASEKLELLKNRIMQTEAVGHAHYDSIEEFGEYVLRDLLDWLNTNFPEGEDVSKIRRQWYNSELLRNYIPNLQLHSFLDSYLGESRKSLMFYGAGARGKTTFLTAWQPQNGHKILINCGSDEKYSYWPSVAGEIIAELHALDETLSFPEVSIGKSEFFISDKEREQFRSAFLDWLQKLELKEDVTIVINDLNLLDDETRHLLSWLPSSCCERLHLICSANEEEMLQNADVLGWNLKEFPLFCKEHANKYLIDCLHAYGKSFSAGQMNTLIHSITTSYPGQLRFMLSFLINHGRFDNLDLLIADLSIQKDIPSVYRYVYEFLIKGCTPKEEQMIRTIFGLLRCSNLSLNEQECYHLSQKDDSHTAMEWARCCRIFEQFELIHGDYWYIRNEETIKFVDQLLSAEELKNLYTLLGDYMLERLALDSSNTNRAGALREHTAFAKEALLHYQKSENWEKLFEALQKDLILYPLSKVDWYTVRVSWMKLFLFSDYDMAKPLLELVETYGNDYGSDNKLVAASIAGLFPDLELRQYTDRVGQIVGLKGSVNRLGETFDQEFSKDFIPMYQKMHTLKSGRNFRRLYDYVLKLLPYKTVFEPSELCNLLFFKADSEDHLGLFREALETTGEYYSFSLKAGNIYEMNRALSMRGNALFRLGRNEEALHLNRQLCRIALSNGDLRAYLSSMNIIGMCQYRIENYEESLQIFDQLIVYWYKLSDPYEGGTIIMNKCNALFLSGQVQSAYDCSKDYYEQIKNIPSLVSLAVRLLGNMGYYAYEMKKYETAEKYLLDTIAQAKQLELESTMLNAYNTLIKVYNDCDRFMDAVEIYEEILAFLWNRRDYSTLIQKLKDVRNLLMDNHYASRAKKLEKEWKEKFSTLENGLQYFEDHISTKNVDHVKADSLREQIAMAKSEHDTKKTARLYGELAQLIGTSDPLQAVTYFLQSAQLYESAGEPDKQQESIASAIIYIFDKGKVLDDTVYLKILRQTTETSILTIADLWRKLGEKEADMKIDEDFSKDLWKILSFIDSRKVLVTGCLTDLSMQIVHCCTAEELLKITEMIPEDYRNWIAENFSSSMFRDFSKILQGIIEDYMSPSAVKTIAFYEKCIQYSKKYSFNDTAGMAGNLALIFRRREEKEKTFYYHTLSMEGYKKDGKTHDYLIEMMNLATAYYTFDEAEKAIELLRKALKETENLGEDRMRASIAGNLASFLMRYDKIGAREEILQCFTIEESSFRACKSYRDLTISLLNQLIFMIDTESPEKWKHKLEEAGEIIRSNGLKEFANALSKLEWRAAQILSAADQTNSEDPREKIEKLLSDKNYHLRSFEPEDDHFHGICQPAGKMAIGAEQLHLFYEPDLPNQLILVGIYRPAMRKDDTLEQVRNYIQWWNSFKKYDLSLDEDHDLRVDIRLFGKDWAELTAQFGEFLSLWEIDKMNVLSLFISLMDLSDCQGAKLRAVNKEDE